MNNLIEYLTESKVKTLYNLTDIEKFIQHIPTKLSYNLEILDGNEYNKRKDLYLYPDNKINSKNKKTAIILVFDFNNPQDDSKIKKDMMLVCGKLLDLCHNEQGDEIENINYDVYNTHDSNHPGLYFVDSHFEGELYMRSSGNRKIKQHQYYSIIISLADDLRKIFNDKIKQL